MVLKHRPGSRALSMPAGLAVGTAISIGTTILLAAVLAKLIVMQLIEETRIGYGVLCILLISSYAGAWTAFSKIKRQRMLVCLLAGIVYLAVLLAATALLFGGQFEAVGVTALLVLGGSVTAGLLGAREKRGGKGRKRYMPNR